MASWAEKEICPISLPSRSQPPSSAQHCTICHSGTVQQWGGSTSLLLMVPAYSTAQPQAGLTRASSQWPSIVCSLGRATGLYSLVGKVSQRLSDHCWLDLHTLLQTLLLKIKSNPETEFKNIKQMCFHLLILENMNQHTIACNIPSAERDLLMPFCPPAALHSNSLLQSSCPYLSFSTQRSAGQSNILLNNYFFQWKVKSFTSHPFTQHRKEGNHTGLSVFSRKSFGIERQKEKIFAL